MGRELRRVPLDFNWPLNKIWDGFINHRYDRAHKCIACDGSGSSPLAKYIHNLWYGYAPFKPEDNGSTPVSADDPIIVAMATRNVRAMKEYRGFPNAYAQMDEQRRLADLLNESMMHHLNQDDVQALIDAGRLHDFTHTWNAEQRPNGGGVIGWVKNNPITVPTAAEVNRWALSGLGHDSINAWVVVRARVKKMGETTRCAKCDGHGHVFPKKNGRIRLNTKYQKRLRQYVERWESTPPPKGPGYQLWETTTEGSPISKVFPTDLKFVDYLIASGYDHRAAWEFVGFGWAPSFVTTGSGVYKDIDSLNPDIHAS